MIAALSACACLAAKDSSALSSALPADRLALANQLSRRGLYADALNEYEALRGSKDVPHDEVLFRLGETYRLLDRRPEALKCYEELRQGAARARPFLGRRFHPRDGSLLPRRGRREGQGR